MKKQKNFRFDDRTCDLIYDICDAYGCKASDVVRTALWNLADVLYSGDEYSDKISALKSVSERILSR